MPLLSICIPTYNRCDLLRELLKSILMQTPDRDIEIVVSDNASEDGTQEMVEAMACRHFPLIRYDRSPVNLGPDANYLRAANLSQGEFFVIMGSDDVFEPNAIAYLLERITQVRADLHLFQRRECDFFLNPLRIRPWWTFHGSDRLIDFSASASRMQYWENSLSLPAIFSYLSSTVVRSSRWKGKVCPPDFIGSGYAHTYIYLKAVLGGTLACWSKAVVACRLGNDTFSKPSNPAARPLLDLRAYARLAQELPAAERPAFTRVLARDHENWYSFSRLLAIKAASPEADWQELTRRWRSIGALRTSCKATNLFPTEMLAFLRRVIRWSRSLM